MTFNEALDHIIKRAVTIEPTDCRIKKAKKEALRLQTKKEIILLFNEMLKISQIQPNNFT